MAINLPKYVEFPADAEELNQTKERFYALSAFPGVVDCIDGTKVRIQAPTWKEYEYVNRKGYHSLNIQIICNAECRIINCVVKWPGGTHDARILRESSIYREFEEGLHEGTILGDSGYPLRHWLMTPILAPTCGAEERYNSSHRTTRTVNERCNGILKRRFQCLHGELIVSPQRAYNIIAACIIFHNRAVDPVDVEDLSEEPHNDGGLINTPSTRAALMRRRIISSHYSH